MTMKMKWQYDRFTNPLARARALGSLKRGSHHWLMHRVVALVSFITLVWGLFALMALVGLTHAGFVDWVSNPINAVMLMLLVAANFYHATLNVTEVIEDYVACKVTKLSMLIGLRVGVFALGALAIFSILKLAI